jgi:hypothetical protein
MPRVRVLRATVAAGRVIGVGEVLDLTDAEVRVLLPLGKVEIVFDGAGFAESAAPVPQHADPTPGRTRRAR